MAGCGEVCLAGGDGLGEVRLGKVRCGLVRHGWAG